MSERLRNQRGGQALPFLLAVVVAAIVVAAGVAIVLVPQRSRASSVTQVPNGDPALGAQIVARTGCGSCHTIPGIEGASGRVGPSLDGFAARQVIAGRIPNEGTQLIRWLQDPQSVDPKTDMPNVGLSRQEAADVAAYLYTLTP